MFGEPCEDPGAVGDAAPAHHFPDQGQVSHDCRTWHEPGDEGGVAGVCGGHVGDQGAGNAEGGGGHGQQFHRVGGRLRVDEIAMSVLDSSKELQVLARSVKNMEQWGDEVAYRYSRPLDDRVTHLEQCWCRGVHRQPRAGYKYWVLCLVTSL